MKGIIVDIKGKYAVAMTKDGSFVKVKSCPGFTVGCEADFNAAPQINTGAVKRLAAIAATLIIALGIGWGVYGMPYSYVSIDINPSIQLTSNLFDRIIKVEALNEDGRKLTASRHVDNMELTDGMAEILDEALKEGYIKDDDYNAVVFSITSKNSGKSEKLEASLKQRAETEFDNDKVESEVITEKYPIEKLKDAREKGVSPGKMSLIEKLVKAKPEMSVDSLKNTSVREIMKSLKQVKEDSKTENEDKDDNINTDKNKNENENGNNGNSDVKQNNGNQGEVKDKDKKGEDKQDKGNKDKDKLSSGKPGNSTKDAVVTPAVSEPAKQPKNGAAADKEKDKNKNGDTEKDKNVDKDKIKDKDKDKDKGSSLDKKDPENNKDNSESSTVNGEKSSDSSKTPDTGVQNNSDDKTVDGSGTDTGNGRENEKDKVEKEEKNSSDEEDKGSTSKDNKDNNGNGNSKDKSDNSNGNKVNKLDNEKSNNGNDKDKKDNANNKHDKDKN